MPFTMTAFLLGALSIIGLPPFGGVWSKWLSGQRVRPRRISRCSSAC